MEDLCTLAQIHPDDLSTHAVSFAALAWAMRDALAAGPTMDRQAFHRAADLALTLFRQEKKRFESMDSSAPLLDSVYLKAFVAGDESEEPAEPTFRAIGGRFHSELLRLVYLRAAEVEETSAGCAKALSRSPVKRGPE